MEGVKVGTVSYSLPSKWSTVWLGCEVSPKLPCETVQEHAEVKGLVMRASASQCSNPPVGLPGG